METVLNVLLPFIRAIIRGNEPANANNKSTNKRMEIKRVQLKDLGGHYNDILS